ncbi:MAG: hypothetical protein JWO46_2103 [Nocardioidaceae bacterium]|nr:hypothetical protein [Nocardioidaceae bacterium]
MMSPVPVTSTDSRAAFARTQVLLVAGGLVVLLLAYAGRYGYHRDELYFVLLGGHPAFGYVDQPALIPLLDHAVDVLSGHSLFWLRVPPALCVGAAAVLVGLTARELGARRGGQVLAAAAWAISAVVLASGHLAGTTAFDLLGWTALTWLVVRALDEGGRWWLWAGLTAGVALEVKLLVAFFLFALTVGLLAVGPRDALRDRFLWVGAALAVVLWLPDLLWQAANGWPQLDLSRSIASGGSGTSSSRWVFVPFQVVQLSPVLVPVWAVGWWRLLRRDELRRWRCFAVAFVVLLVVFIATGGKPYHLTGAYAALFAAGAQPVVDWCRRGWLVGALVVGGAISALLFVPILPVSAIAGTPITAINYDAGETVGWPGFVATVRAAWEALPSRSHAAILANNYGEAGAVARFAPDLPVYSGHNSLRALGGPPDDTTTVLALGFDATQLRALFGTVTKVATAPTPYGIDNDEAGEPIYVASDPLRPWPQTWRRLERYG